MFSLGLLPLASYTLKIGILSKNAHREGSPLNNPTLAYIQEETRPFMLPGLENAKDKIVQAHRGKTPLQFLEYVGQTVVDEIKAVIESGIPPPLSANTLKNRLETSGISARARQGTKEEIAYRQETGKLGMHAIPLIVTEQLINSIGYEIGTS